MRHVFTAAFAALAIGLIFPACSSDESTSPTGPAQPSFFSPLATATGVVLLEDLSDAQVHPTNNWWNLDVSKAPVDAKSSSFISWIGTGKTLHPDLAPPPYGIPYIGVSGTQPLVSVTFTSYASESDKGAPGRPLGYPIPAEAKTQPNYIENGTPGGNGSGDRHMLIVDRDNWILFELAKVRWTGSRWEASCGAIFDLKSNYRRPEGWTSTDAAGLAIFPGLIRYDEAVDTVPITHAFRVAVRASNGYVWPASHAAGTTSGAPPLGTRFRLKASKDISAYPSMVKRIFQAMKTYGLIFADNGSDMYITGTMDSRWDNGVLNNAFDDLKASDFEVIQLGWGKTTASSVR